MFAPAGDYDWITDAIAVGRFASPERAVALREAGVTHILNVSNSGSTVSALQFGFASVDWISVTDLTTVSTERATRCLDRLHEMVSTPDSRVYVHCHAGQNRAPTIVWLYFLACGLDRQSAREWIESRRRDAVAGHSRLVNERLCEAVIAHGRLHYLPHPRVAALPLLPG